MHDWIGPVIIVPSIFYCLYLIIKTVSDNTVRRQALSKCEDKELVESIFRDVEISKSVNFYKFGYIFVAIGIAAVISESLRLDDQTAFGLYTFFIGLAILISHKLEKH